MSLIAKHLPKYKKEETTGLTTVNLAEIAKAEINAAGKEPFRMDEFPELVKLGYASNITIKAQDTIFTSIKGEDFLRAYRLQRVVTAIGVVNEQKRKGGAKT